MQWKMITVMIQTLMMWGIKTNENVNTYHFNKLLVDSENFLRFLQLYGCIVTCAG